jgi:hypothetical protein
MSRLLQLRGLGGDDAVEGRVYVRHMLQQQADWTRVRGWAVRLLPVAACEAVEDKGLQSSVPIDA